jgi:arsenate reductase (glutaredoxin)
MTTSVTVWYNPRCSKCRGAEELLAAHGVVSEQIRYLDDPPSEAEIRRVLRLLGLTDPRGMMRTGEPIYRELGLSGANEDALIAAMAQHPVLIERPIVIRGESAVIARPPELLLDLLDER